MRTSIIIAKAATRATWPLTRRDRRGPLGPIVLCYHRVLPRSATSQEMPAYSVTPEQFREQMRLLIRERFRSVTLEDFRQSVRAARELPARSVLVTFDDGFADTYLSAWPIAREVGINLNLFLCTGLVAGEAVEQFDRLAGVDRANQTEFPELWQSLTWDMVREMKTAGVGIGFHSHTHRNLGRLSLAEITEDARRGLLLWAQQLGDQPFSFAFPFGQTGSYTAAAISALREFGLEIFFSTELGVTSLRDSGPFSRIVIHPEDDLQTFRRKLYGGYDWVGRLRRFGYALSGAVRQDARESSSVKSEPGAAATG